MNTKQMTVPGIILLLDVCPAESQTNGFLTDNFANKAGFYTFPGVLNLLCDSNVYFGSSESFCWSVDVLSFIV